MTKKTRILVTGIIVAIAVAFMPMLGDEVSAATKKPAKPKIISATTSYNTATIKWGKAKGAKKYQVSIQSAKKKWVKYKTVKKNAKNKKKYTKKNKYRVKAKGKKYIVYQYTYTYTKKKNITARTFKFTGLKYNTTYTFAVRSVNGNKYSAWSTVKRVTKVYPTEPIDDSLITKPGTVVPVTIGGTENTLIIGKETTYNIPNTTGLNTELNSINITPTSVEAQDWGVLNVVGTINGIPNSDYAEAKTDWACNRELRAPQNQKTTKYGYTIENGWSNQYFVSVTDPHTKVYWTLDGTEPIPGQENLTVAGSDYPLGTLKRGRIYWPEPETIKIRGTVNNGETGCIFEETMANYINACVWIKAYHNNNLVGVYYFETADEQFWPYGDELW